MASTQLRTQAHELERHQQDKTHCGPLSPHLKSPGSGSEGHTRVLRPPHDQGSSSQSFQDPHLYTSQGPQDPDLCPGYQEHNQHFNLQLHAAAELRMMSSPEQGAPSSPVEPWVPPSRSGDQNISHSEPLAHCRPAHGLMPRTHLPTQLQPHTKPVSTIQTSSRHFSDSAAMQHQHWDPRDQDREHPLTRLENALAEVQQCSGPDAVDCASSRDRGGFSESCRGPVRSLSVLEKVSRLERQEHARKQRSQSTSTSFNKPPHLPNGRSSPCGAEDLRHMLERSTKSAKVHRMMSLQGGSCEQAKHRTPADPSSALQRSRSTYQVAESTERDGSRDVPGRHHIQELLGPIQDIPYIRNSLKDTQSAAPCSISFRQRDLRSSVSDPPAAPPPLSSTSSHRPPPVPAKYQSLEKKGPKTMPKPQGVIITPQSIPPITSPHTPKERHVVSPDVRGLSPPTLPSVPPVGPPALPRICGRRRLTADQKKRCYSEPENMNEVGVSDPETVALFRHGGETSVADRRKMFEFAANRVGGSTWRPDLRQLQQDALVQYFERKRAGGRTEGGRRTGSRPRSAYLLPENCNYTDSCSLSSASSLLSLQDAGLQSNLFYPGRVTTPRLPPHPLTGPTPDLQAHNEPAPLPVKSSQCQSPSSHLGLGPAMQRPQAEASVPRPMTPQLRGALLRAGSASAESLLDGPQERVLCVQHQRSRSSPSAERLNQDLVPGDGGMFGVFRLCVDRSADVHVEGGPASPEPAHISVNDTPPAGSSQGSSHTPVTPRERQRTSERQRAHSTAALAASVGLPCPFSPPGTTDGVSMEWQASERLSQANLDAITFPQISTGDSKDPSAGPPVNSDTSMDIYRDRAISLGTGRSHAAENTIPGAVAETPPSHSQPEALASTDDGRKTSSSPSLSHPSLSQLLVSLQGSESGHNHSTDQQLPLEQSIDMPMQEDYDDVFLHSPCPPSLLLLQETMITGDFPPPPPPPPPPVVFEQVADSSIPIINHFLQSSPASSSPSGPSSVSSIKPQVTIITASKTAEDHLGLEYQPVPKREKMSEEQRVETLAQELVLQDPSLAPILDTRGWRSTVDLIDLIFPNCKLNIRSQHRVDGSVPVQSKEPAGGREADTGEDQKDLTTTKVKLCEALRSSMAALQREKEALCEEQRSHQMLGASIQTLVQELLKPNERDKFCMLIGDLDKIVNLLLSLCSRLSRIERSLLSLQRSQLSAEDAAEERESLDHKRSVVLRQTEDACELKENLDRRQCVVHAILRGYLTEPQLKDYCHFVRTEPSLLICQRRLDDLMRLEEEQLAHLVESLPVEVAEAHGRWAAATAPPFLGSTVPCSSPSSLPPAASTTMGDVHPIRSTTVTSL